MFHPGVTGSCGNHTQKHTLSATPTVRRVIQRVFDSAQCHRRRLERFPPNTVSLYVWSHMFFCFSGCTDDIVTSDHSPVFATFEVGVTSQFVSKKGTVYDVLL